MTGLRLQAIQKAFGDVEVIKGVDLDVEDGELAVFVGPSGCGKSTLLRIISGLESVTSGRIFIGGRDVTNVPPAKRGIAMVFQSYALFPHMTVAENISFGIRLAGVGRAEIERKVAEVSEVLQISPLLDRRPKQLSGGQRQRVAIGRAIIRNPQVFLFDEPLSNLDAALRVQMRLEIARLHRQLGATMVYVTHDQVEAMTLADKIVVMRAGRVEQVGSPMTLYDAPDNIFVAGFIGSPKMNFLRAVVEEAADSKITVSLPDYAGVRVPFAVASKAPEKGRELILGIRPEHFDPAGEIRLTAKVDFVERLGGNTLAYSQNGAAAPLTIDLKSDRSVVEGMVITTGFHAERAHLFEPASGMRIR